MQSDTLLSWFRHIYICIYSWKHIYFLHWVNSVQCAVNSVVTWWLLVSVWLKPTNPNQPKQPTRPNKLNQTKHSKPTDPNNFVWRNAQSKIQTMLNQIKTTKHNRTESNQTKTKPTKPNQPDRIKPNQPNQANQPTKPKQTRKNTPNNEIRSLPRTTANSGLHASNIYRQTTPPTPPASQA